MMRDVTDMIDFQSLAHTVCNLFYSLKEESLTLTHFTHFFTMQKEKRFLNKVFRNFGISEFRSLNQ